MKIFFMRTWKCAVVASVVLEQFVGCTTPRHAPSPRPRFVTDYRDEFVHQRLKRLPVKLEFREFDRLDSIVLDTGTTIAGTSYELLPFKSIVQREFEELISRNFCLAGKNGVKSKLVMEVVPANYNIELNAIGDVDCNMDFSIRLSAPKTDFPPRVLSCKAVADYRDIEGVIPCSLYAAIQKAAKDCISEISYDVDLMGNLDDLLERIGHGDLYYEPILHSAGAGAYFTSARSGSYYTEAAHVKCNDDDFHDVEKWAKEQIKKVRGELHFKNSKCCVFFLSSKYDKDTTRLDLLYDIIEWNDFIVIPDGANGRFGRCFIDYGSFKYQSNEDAKAKENMRERLLGLSEQIYRTSAANVVLRNFRKDADNFGFRVAEYEYE